MGRFLMPEIRQNLVTREWVILATERAQRPEQFSNPNECKKELPRWDENCPFCPGNEHLTPPEIWRIGRSPEWDIRLIPNKYAALEQEGFPKRKIDGIKRSINGVGYHEVLIESPLHNTSIAKMKINELKEMIKAYKDRFLQISTDDRIELVVIFKNHGERAGTSLEHPHSQIVGLPIMPQQVRSRVEEAMRYYDDTGECVFCRILQDELKEGSRIIVESTHFVSFIPYASLSPFHMWIYPRRHTHCFTQITDEESEDFAFVLRTTLAKLYHGLNDPDYNYVIRSLPRFYKKIDYAHWYLSIVPRITRVAGFELGSGMYINTALPEESAQFLRDVKVQSF
jgi:UDPglucose--hexose-1-phosphate uridylyltransferase